MPTITVAQAGFSDDNGVSGTTLTVTLTGVASGSILHAWAGSDDNGGSPPSYTISDDKNGTWPTSLDAQDSTPDGQELRQFRYAGATAGTTIITLTCSSAITFKSLCVAEVTGAALAVTTPDQHTSQIQTAPAATTDAVTSGNMTPSSQPALVLGLSFCPHGGTSTPVTGTGFTSAGIGWFTENQARAEYKRVTSTAAVAATFTRGVAGSHLTFAAVYLEAGVSDVPWPASQRVNRNVLLRL